jgi:ABC-type glutathione transport system ATPase component
MSAVPAATAGTPVLSVDGLSIGAGGATDSAAIVRNLSFTVNAGEVVGIVGESGSGKTLTAYAIADVLPENVHVTSGRIALEGCSLQGLGSGERRALSGSRIGLVFQDPLSSFNPVRTIGSILIESAMRHRGLSAAAARNEVIAALHESRLQQPELMIDAYPHQLSGGQRQRAMIALARLNSPALLIADEPTTALDATVQLQILALLKRSVGAGAMVLITHDLRVAAMMCDRMLVMQRGQCIEEGPAGQILSAPRHPYTRQLLAAAYSLTHSDEASDYRQAPQAP